MIGAILAPFCSRVAVKIRVTQDLRLPDRINYAHTNAFIGAAKSESYVQAGTLCFRTLAIDRELDNVFMPKHSQRSVVRTILTDLHFWLPMAVLVAGIGLLFVLTRA
jgi:hypothetical protein